MGAGTHLACDVAWHVVVVMAGGGCERMVMVQYLSLPHLFLLDSGSPVGFLLDSNKISKKAFSHIFSFPPTALLLDSYWIPTGFLLDSN